MPIEPQIQTPSGKTHLVIPDAHAMPNQDLRRFEWLGKFILDNQPDVIVQIGDWWDMPSLCSYDQGKKSFVFQSLREDIESGHRAELLAYGPIVEMNKQRAQNRKKQYRPSIIKVMGNHEARVSKLLQFEPRWEGTVSMDDFRTRLPISETFVDFLDTIVVDGIVYSHYFISGVMGRPVSSAKVLLQKAQTSCTMGHTHLLDGADGDRPDGSRTRALICGSYHDPDHRGFGGPQVDTKYWNGLILKHNVHQGNYDREEISVSRLQRRYTNND